MFVVPDIHVRNACRTLFGPAVGFADKFLQTLQINSLKSTFRKKALETHPDRFHGLDPWIQQKKTEQFVVVTDAYAKVRSYCEKRDGSCQGIRARAINARAVREQSEKNDTCFSGVVPMRRLTIGSYLYYSGNIPYRALIKALAWQRSLRPSLGSIARQWGWLNDMTISAILSYQGNPRLFGERAESLRLLTPSQVKTLLAFQRLKQKRLGQYFVENGYLSSDRVERLVIELKRHNACQNMPHQNMI